MAKHDELWQEYSLNGLPIGEGREPADFYENIGRYACGVVHVWLYRKTAAKGRELLFQKRSQTVDRNPGKWDISAAGHVNAGESKLAAAVREAREELGATINADNLSFVLSHYGRKQNGIHTAYLYEWDGSETFQFDDGEVEDVQWVPVSEVMSFVRANVKTSLAELDWYWEKLLSNLEDL